MLSLIHVPLNALHVSPLNARRTNAEEDIPALAADIAERGLKQNLVAVPEGEPGEYGVVAGGRRLRALQLNAAEGRIDQEELVPVLVEAPDDGRETSLAENIQRIAMNPADEAIAYRTIVDEHDREPDPVAYTARRFRVTERHVAQRLKLARLAPPILDALRAAEIAIGAAQAYAGFDDVDLQLAVFRNEQARQFGARHEPRNIRDALRGRTLPASDRQARYVGLDAYLAAGGRTDTDLFMGVEDGERILDPALLERLAFAKARTELPSLARADGFRDGTLPQALTALPVWPRAPEGYAQHYGCTLDDIAPDQRACSIAGYMLDEAGALVFATWWEGSEPVAETAPPRPTLRLVHEARAAPAVAPAPSAPLATGSHRPGDLLAAQAAQRREDRIGVIAAHLAVERAAEIPAERVRWPESDEIVYGIQGDPGDDDTLLVAVQVRVPRAELEALLGEAEQLLEEEECANDLVAAAEGDPAPADDPGLADDPEPEPVRGGGEPPARTLARRVAAALEAVIG